jgi:endoglucanase
MTFDLKDHLKNLTERHGVSGYEAPIRAYLRETWSGWIDEFQVDGLGSLIAIKHGMGSEPRRRIMLAAHMDEIGLMVGEIREGYLRLQPLNGFDGRVLQAKPVIVHGKQALRGIIAAVPPHISKHTGDGQSKYPAINEQWVDLGLSPEEVEALVSVGDVVTMDAPLLELKNGLLVGKAMDDRASVAAVSYCLELLGRRKHEWDVYAVATVQEEIDLYGAATSAYAIKPDLAIAIDVTFGKQPGVNDSTAFVIGKGPTLGLGPNFHAGFRKMIQNTAKEYDVPIHTEVLPSDSGTDAWAIQVTHQGIPSALLSIPIRNMHTPAETVSLRDIKRTGRLLAEIITLLDGNTLEKIAEAKPSKENDQASDDAEEAED